MKLRHIPGVPASRRGIALIITLILLAVITFMAIAFLVLSNAQRAAVTTTTDQNIARNAADAGLSRAENDLLSQILANGNPFNVGLRVSTNYINPYGFTNGVASPLNVNYDFLSTGGALNGLQQQQNIANLLIDPRPPVFIQTNAAGSNDFRFFLDLNRNARFEPTGWEGVTNDLGQPIVNPLGPVVSFFTGDPQWIGGLQFPDRPHASDNQFIYRYAYIALPASQSLDLNYIYNDATDPNGQMAADHFMRNQGASTYEVNLAAFLADLNTNVWFTNSDPYMYLTPPGGLAANRGKAFEDALGLLRYRYGGTTGTLANVTSLFGPNGVYAFAHDYIDDFSAGPVMTNAWWSPLTGDADLNRISQNFRWAGANNTNHYFTDQDLFDATKVSPQFAANLQRAGAGLSSYNRYTFYRMLSQLGTDTDSASDLNKINLNYDNKVRANAQGIVSGTNFYTWDPAAFFTNTAIALLANAGYAAGPNLSLTNIPLLSVNGQGQTNFQIEIWPINNYTPSVHRLLQLAANIYDSTTNRLFNNAATYPYCPSVFRPIFRRTTILGTNAVFIVGYREVLGTTLIAAGGAGAPDIELDSNPRNVNAIPPMGTPILPPGGPERLEPLVSGIPLVIGAKKGFPNFNEFSMQTCINVSRLLEFRRDTIDGPVRHTNQMYVATITNAFGLEAWNAYAASYPRPLELIAVAKTTALMTNEFGNLLLSSPVTNIANVLNIAALTWPGWTSRMNVGNSFLLPWGTNGNFSSLTNSSYTTLPSPPQFIPLTHIFANVNTEDTYPIPHWWLNLNTRVRYILVDTGANRIVDYVDLNYWQPTLDLNAQLAPPSTDCSGNPAALSDPVQRQWVLFCTNRVDGSLNVRVPTQGIVNQISLGLGINPNVNLTSFSLDTYAGLDSESAMDGFRYNLMGWGPAPQNPKDIGKTFYRSNIFYAPFAPNNPVFIHLSLQANDPLVHYTVGDLMDLSSNPTNMLNNISHNPPLDNLGLPNGRYQPWGGNPFGAASNPTMPAYQIAAKDPFVTRPDNWEFPTNKYPNVGWLGRVHRGTPWQTLYLKSPSIAPGMNGLAAAGVIANGSGAPVWPGFVGTGFGWPGWLSGTTNGVLSPAFGIWQMWSGNQQWVTNFGQLSTNICPVYNPRLLPSSANNLAAMVPDAMFSLPTNDWHVLDLFTTSVNENSQRGRLSVNQTNLAAWSGVLSGVNVLPDLLTNSVSIPPAGAYTFPTGIVAVVNGIINSRTNFPNWSYQRLGDILATPQLTVASPFLTTGNTNYMNDEVVERIPQQILGLLKGGEAPRYVIYTWGQALKPALHSVVPNGTFSGMVTNYQITAEVATRAVVRIDGAQPVPGQPYHPRAVIENFNVLPPE
jgi:hypothetical protein